MAGQITGCQLHRWVSEGKMKFESDGEIGVVSAVMWILCNKLTQQRQTEPAAKPSLIDQPSALLSLVVRKGLVSTCGSNLFHSHGVLCVVNRTFGNGSSFPNFCLSLRFLLNLWRKSGRSNIKNLPSDSFSAGHNMTWPIKEVGTTWQKQEATSRKRGAVTNWLHWWLGNLIGPIWMRQAAPSYSLPRIFLKGPVLFKRCLWVLFQMLCETQYSPWIHITFHLVCQV